MLEEINLSLELPDGGDLYRGLLERVERPLLKVVLERTEGNQIRAAAILGIGVRALESLLARARRTLKVGLNEEQI